MTTVRIAHTEPWPGGRVGGRGFGFYSMLVVLADDSGGRALPVWLNGPEGHGLCLSRLVGGLKLVRLRRLPGGARPWCVPRMPGK
jgi:hypothetical protein